MVISTPKSYDALSTQPRGMLRDPLFAEILDSAFHAPGRSLEVVTVPGSLLRQFFLRFSVNAASEGLVRLPIEGFFSGFCKGFVGYFGKGLIGLCSYISYRSPCQRAGPHWFKSCH